MLATVRKQLFPFLLGIILSVIGVGFALHFRSPLQLPSNAQLFDPDMIELKIREAPKDAEIVFLGDSITDRWRFREILWNRFRHPANLGVGGSRIANLLWLVNSGKLASFHPQIFVVLIGANDTYPPPKFFERRLPSEQQRTEGIRMIADSLTRRFPQSTIVLTLAPDEHVALKREHLITISPFSSGDVTADGVHLNDQGYEHWAAALAGVTVPPAAGLTQGSPDAK
jgi:lysophospholipase L1-like esterase